MKKLFLLFIAISVMSLSVTPKGGGGGGGGTYVPTTVRTRTMVLDFYYPNAYNQPPTYGYQPRPYLNDYLARNSETIFNLYSSRYYCEVSVISGDNSYNKSYTWKRGSSMDIDVPNNKSYTITVKYYEPWSCPIYTYSGSLRGSGCRAFYIYKQSFTNSQAWYNLELKFNYFYYY